MGSAAGARKAAASRIGISLGEYDARLLAGQKWCGKCRQWHRKRAFGSDTSRADGLSPVCLASRGRAVDSPGKAERRGAARRGEAWCRDCTAWIPAGEVAGGRCREHRNESYRARYATDGEGIRQRVYARKRALDAIPGWLVEDKRADFDGLCAYGCGRAGTTNDHIWPVSRGGKSRPANIVPACRSCNSRKRDSDPLTWVERGLNAFPSQWEDLIALALEHGTDEWTGVA